jgi:hypothetical protein
MWIEDSQEFEIGRAGEVVIAGMLRAGKWYVNPTCEYSGKDSRHAPMAANDEDVLILPDFDIAKRGQRKWVEVKSYAGPARNRRTNRLVHGISKRHYQHYVSIENVTGCEVWLFIYEYVAKHVVYAHIGTLAQHSESEGLTRLGPQYYFDRSDFKEVRTGEHPLLVKPADEVNPSLLAWHWRSNRYDPKDGRYGGTYLAPAGDDINTVKAYLESFFQGSNHGVEMHPQGGAA